jgi:glycyl-tRNA synthetase
MDKALLDSLLKRRMFFTPAFEIHEAVKGLFDYGPPLCALQANFVAYWRHFFVLKERMLEVEPTILTPYKVLKTSGHVDKFADWCVKDPKSGEIFRADHLVEGVLEARLNGDQQARGEVAEVVADPAAAADAKKKKKLKTKNTAIKLDDAVRDEYISILAKIDNYGGPELGMYENENENERRGHTGLCANPKSTKVN